MAGAMGDIINLNKAKKARAKAEAKTKADANRAAHGQTKAGKTLNKAQKKLTDTKLDAHKRSTDGADG
jgi:hypothetical protein